MFVSAKGACADVQKPLIIVARICGVGHIVAVVFRQDGGCTSDAEASRRTHFKRMDNVYLLGVENARRAVGFHPAGAAMSAEHSFPCPMKGEAEGVGVGKEVGRGN